jgi:hypothetical protein
MEGCVEVEGRRGRREEWTELGGVNRENAHLFVPSPSPIPIPIPASFTRTYGRHWGKNGESISSTQLQPREEELAKQWLVNAKGICRRERVRNRWK